MPGVVESHRTGDERQPQVASPNRSCRHQAAPGPDRCAGSGGLAFSISARLGEPAQSVVTLSNSAIRRSCITMQRRIASAGRQEKAELSRSLIVLLRLRMKLVSQLAKDMGGGPDWMSPVVGTLFGD
jgi:hypothetical protein